jgi:hypothetical protein
MRYIPSSRYTLDEIAEQCRQAVLKARTDNNCASVPYEEVRKFFRYDDAYSVRPMKDYGSLIKA